VEVNTEKGPVDIQKAVTEMLAKEHIPWQHQRDTGPHEYDLRTLIDSISVERWEPRWEP
jgi:hypothetical protein